MVRSSMGTCIYPCATSQQGGCMFCLVYVGSLQVLQVPPKVQKSCRRGGTSADSQPIASKGQTKAVCSLLG